MDYLSERHLFLFGAIIQWFARYELLMQETMATIIGSDTASVKILTSDLDFIGKRQAMLDLLRHKAIPLNQFDHICAYLRVPGTFIQLRNDIAHSTWVFNQPPDSIQPNWILQLPPGVKALHDDPNAPSKNFIEREPDKVAYSLDELAEIVETLAANHRQFSGYLHEIALIRG